MTDNLTVPTPTPLDRRLHILSLQVANLFYELREMTPQQLTDDLLFAYRCIRRHISNEPAGNRFGSHAAYQAMRGLIE